jgi:putative glycosyltransferase (TIGR04372 family)
MQKVLLPLFNDALGDNIVHSYVGANVSTVLGAEQTVLVYEDRPYKREMTQFFNPWANQIVSVDAPRVLLFPDLYRNFYILSCASMQWTTAAQFEDPVFLRPVRERPENEKVFVVCEQLLEGLGLQAGSWHCIIHSRELGYKHKYGHANLRCADPMNYFRVAQHVVDRLGGQVVRVGDPSMTRWPKKEGIIDLTRLDGVGVFICQAFALSKARFVVATDGGIHPVGSAFGVPTLLSNLTTGAFCWNPWDLLLTKHFHMDDGRVLSNEHALLGNVLRYQDSRDIPAEAGIQRIEDNSVEELIAATEQLHQNAVNLSRPTIPTHTASSQKRMQGCLSYPGQRISCVGASFFPLH